MFNFEKLETWQEAIQGFLSRDGFNRLYAAAEKQGKMLSGLRASLVNQRASD